MRKMGAYEVSRGVSMLKRDIWETRIVCVTLLRRPHVPKKLAWTIRTVRISGYATSIMAFLHRLLLVRSLAGNVFIQMIWRLKRQSALGGFIFLG